MPPVTLGKGETWDSSNWPATRTADTPENDATTGVRVMKSASADGHTRKTGLEELEVSAVASGVGRVLVEKGTLHLAAGESTAVTTDVGIGSDSWLVGLLVVRPAAVGADHRAARSGWLVVGSS